MIIVISVVVVLASMLILGINHVLKSSKESATKVTLQNLAGMLAELDGKTHLLNSPTFWRWPDDGASGLSANVLPNEPVNFWKLPLGSSTSGAASYRDVPPAHDALDAPGDVRAGSGDLARNASRQILYTQQAIAMILAMPNNRTALAKYPPDRLFSLNFMTGLVATPGKDGVLGANTDGTETTEPVFYPPGAKVTASGAHYICVNPAGIQAAGTTPANPDWIADSTSPVPLVLDSWGNPILFVPATGLRVRVLNGQSTYSSTDISQTAIIVSPEGQVTAATSTAQPMCTKAGRPFFASAGPDGDFSKGDDNIYSFEP